MTTSDAISPNMPEIQALKSTQDVETALREINGQEQLYSMALFDILEQFSEIAIIRTKW